MRSVLLNGGGRRGRGSERSLVVVCRGDARLSLGLRSEAGLVFLTFLL